MQKIDFINNAGVTPEEQRRIARQILEARAAIEKLEAEKADKITEVENLLSKTTENMLINQLKGLKVSIDDSYRAQIQSKQADILRIEEQARYAGLSKQQTQTIIGFLGDDKIQQVKLEADKVLSEADKEQVEKAKIADKQRLAKKEEVRKEFNVTRDKERAEANKAVNGWLQSYEKASAELTKFTKGVTFEITSVKDTRVELEKRLLADLATEISVDMISDDDLLAKYFNEYQNHARTVNVHVDSVEALIEESHEKLHNLKEADTEGRSNIQARISGLEDKVEELKGSPQYLIGTTEFPIVRNQLTGAVDSDDESVASVSPTDNALQAAGRVSPVALDSLRNNISSDLLGQANNGIAALVVDLKDIITEYGKIMAQSPVHIGTDGRFVIKDKLNSVSDNSIIAIDKLYAKCRDVTGGREMRNAQTIENLDQLIRNAFADTQHEQNDEQDGDMKARINEMAAQSGALKLTTIQDAMSKCIDALNPLSKAAIMGPDLESKPYLSDYLKTAKLEIIEPEHVLTQKDAKLMADRAADEVVSLAEELGFKLFDGGKPTKFLEQIVENTQSPEVKKAFSTLKGVVERDPSFMSRVKYGMKNFSTEVSNAYHTVLNCFIRAFNSMFKSRAMGLYEISGYPYRTLTANDITLLLGERSDTLVTMQSDAIETGAFNTLLAKSASAELMANFVDQEFDAYAFSNALVAYEAAPTVSQIKEEIALTHISAQKLAVGQLKELAEKRKEAKEITSQIADLTDKRVSIVDLKSDLDKLVGLIESAEQATITTNVQAILHSYQSTLDAAQAGTAEIKDLLTAVMTAAESVDAAKVDSSYSDQQRALLGQAIMFAEEEEKVIESKLMKLRKDHDPVTANLIEMTKEALEDAEAAASNSSEENEIDFGAKIGELKQILLELEYFDGYPAKVTKQATALQESSAIVKKMADSLESNIEIEIDSVYEPADLNSVSGLSRIINHFKQTVEAGRKSLVHDLEGKYTLEFVKAIKGVITTKMFSFTPIEDFSSVEGMLKYIAIRIDEVQKRKDTLEADLEKIEAKHALERNVTNPMQEGASGVIENETENDETPLLSIEDRKISQESDEMAAIDGAIALCVEDLNKLEEAKTMFEQLNAPYVEALKHIDDVTKTLDGKVEALNGLVSKKEERSANKKALAEIRKRLLTVIRDMRPKEEKKEDVSVTAEQVESTPLELIEAEPQGPVPSRWASIPSINVMGVLSAIWSRFISIFRQQSATVSPEHEQEFEIGDVHEDRTPFADVDDKDLEATVENPLLRKDETHEGDIAEEDKAPTKDAESQSKALLGQLEKFTTEKNPLTRKRRKSVSPTPTKGKDDVLEHDEIPPALNPDEDSEKKVKSKHRKGLGKT